MTTFATVELSQDQCVLRRPLTNFAKWRPAFPVRDEAEKPEREGNQASQKKQKKIDDSVRAVLSGKFLSSYRNQQENRAANQ